jgi:hypothetical protein
MVIMEDQPETPSTVTAPDNWVRLRKCDIRSQNKRTIYNVYSFLKHISEQPEHFSDISVHKVQDLTVKVCGVHRSSVPSENM